MNLTIAEKRKKLESEVIVPEIDPELGFSVFRYEELKNDDIFMFKVPHELTVETKKYADYLRSVSTEVDLAINHSVLAGDISEEYSLKFYDNTFLFEKIHKMLCQYFSMITNKPIVQVLMERGWVNYQKPNEFNPFHSHTGVCSLVWYLDVPECVREEHKLQTSNSVCRGLISFFSTYGNSEVTFNPQTDDLLIFNANHAHQVAPYRSDVERVSVSFNIEQIFTHNEYGKMVGVF